MALLSPYRILDLTDERGLLAGRILADLGAEVIVVEPPGGSSARRAGPLDSRLDPLDRSLLWQAYAIRHRSIVCDLDREDDRATFVALAATADVVIESGASGLDLTAAETTIVALRSVNPGLIRVRISPFGPDGPRADSPATDLTIWAAGGALSPNREQDRPPVRPSVDQAWRHAAADAAVGALLALHARHADGCGQDVEISAQRSVAQATLGSILAAAIGDDRPDPRTAHRSRQQQSATVSDRSGSGTSSAASKWTVRDGVVELHLASGPAVGSFTNALFAWIAESVAVPESVAAIDWSTLVNTATGAHVTAADRELARAVVAAHLARHTREELLAAAVTRRLLIAPLMTVSDHLTDGHLRERRALWSLDVPAADGTVQIVTAGAFARSSDDTFATPRRAPRLGEHTADIRDELARRRPVATVRSGAGLPPSADGQPIARPALHGVRVLDLSWVVAGPVVGRTLADFGAEVIRLEHPDRVDTARVIAPFHGGVDGLERSACYGNANAGKLGLGLDLRHPEAAPVVADLVAWADVVVESFAPGVIERLGLGYDTVRSINPGVVMLSTSLMGQTGPLARFAGFGNLGAALSGFADLTGWPDLPPSGPYGPYTDYLAPRLATAVVLAALDRRRRTGRGCYLDVAQLESALLFLAPEIAAASTGTPAPRRNGNRSAAMSPHGVYPVAADHRGDRFVAIAVATDEQWQRLAAVLDLAGRHDDRFATAAGRLEHVDALDELVAAATSGWPGEELAARLCADGVPAALAASSADMLDDPQLAALGHFVTVSHRELGTTVVEGPRQTLSRTPGAPRRGAPCRGEHNRQILTRVLGYSDATVERLLAGGAFGNVATVGRTERRQDELGSATVTAAGGTSR